MGMYYFMGILLLILGFWGFWADQPVPLITGSAPMISVFGVIALVIAESIRRNAKSKHGGEPKD